LNLSGNKFRDIIFFYLFHTVVYNIKSRRTRLVYITPQANWGGMGLIGVTIRLDDYALAQDQLIRVLEIEEGSPAHVAGLEPDTDYLLGTATLSFGSTQILGQVLQASVNVPLEIYVYSTHTDEVRVVTLLPTKDWGVDDDDDAIYEERGLLGAEVGVGYLHSFPESCRQTDGTSVLIHVVRVSRDQQPIDLTLDPNQQTIPNQTQEPKAPTQQVIEEDKMLTQTEPEVQAPIPEEPEILISKTELKAEPPTAITNVNTEPAKVKPEIKTEPPIVKADVNTDIPKVKPDSKTISPQYQIEQAQEQPKLLPEEKTQPKPSNIETVEPQVRNQPALKPSPVTGEIQAMESGECENKGILLTSFEIPTHDQKQVSEEEGPPSPPPSPREEDGVNQQISDLAAAAAEQLSHDVEDVTTVDEDTMDASFTTIESATSSLAQQPIKHPGLEYEEEDESHPPPPQAASSSFFGFTKYMPFRSSGGTFTPPVSGGVVGGLGPKPSFATMPPPPLFSSKK